MIISMKFCFGQTTLSENAIKSYFYNNQLCERKKISIGSMINNTLNSLVDHLVKEHYFALQTTSIPV